MVIQFPPRLFLVMYSVHPLHLLVRLSHDLACCGNKSIRRGFIHGSVQVECSNHYPGNARTDTEIDLAFHQIDFLGAKHKPAWTRADQHVHTDIYTQLLFQCGREGRQPAREPKRTAGFNPVRPKLGGYPGPAASWTAISRASVVTVFHCPVDDARWCRSENSSADCAGACSSGCSARSASIFPIIGVNLNP